VATISTIVHHHGFLVDVQVLSVQPRLFAPLPKCILEGGFFLLSCAFREAKSLLFAVNNHRLKHAVMSSEGDETCSLRPSAIGTLDIVQSRGTVILAPAVRESLRPLETRKLAGVSLEGDFFFSCCFSPALGTFFTTFLAYLPSSLVPSFLASFACFASLASLLAFIPPTILASLAAFASFVPFLPAIASL